MPGDFDLDSLLIPSQVSLSDERNNSLVVSEYLLKNPASNAVDISSYKNTVTIDLEDMSEHQEINFSKISQDELFDLMNSKTLVTNPQLFFPKIKHINDLFWLLNNLSEINLTKTKILLSDILSKSNTLLVHASEFFGYFKLLQEDNKLYLIPTSVFKTFSKLNLENKYLFFLENVGADKTTRDCINIQLNDPIYDRLSRYIVFKKLKENYNIVEEKLTDKEISNIVNNVRYWYLDIKK